MKTSVIKKTESRLLQTYFIAIVKQGSAVKKLRCILHYQSDPGIRMTMRPYILTADRQEGKCAPPRLETDAT